METKNRKIEELLVLLREFIVDYELFICMCTTVTDMDTWFSVLDTKEVKTLKDFIKSKIPEGLNPLELWFPIGEKQPRIDWINEQIKILQNGK
jgi:hypothetical protein